MTSEQRFRRMKAMGNNVWTTAKRQRLKWREMNVPHIRNAANFLNVRIKKLEDEIDACYAPMGDMASYYAEIAANAAAGQLEHLRSVQERLLEYALLREEFMMIGEGP